MIQTRTINATEFKAKCLEILDRLADRSLDEVVITKRGRTVAVLTPPPGEVLDIHQLHGFMRGTVVIPEGFDLTEPVLDEPLNADRGILHE